MTKTTQLAHGQITNHDEITVMLVEPTDGALVRVQRPRRITTTTAANFPAAAAAITRIIAGFEGHLRRTSDGPQLKWFVGRPALFGMARYPTPAKC